MIEESGDEKYSSEWSRMRDIHNNESDRREYMMRQTMTKSLIHESQIL